MQVASRKKTISYADYDDGNEEDSFKIRSGRRRYDEVTCGKFGCVYSHNEFVLPYTYYASAVAAASVAARIRKLQKRSREETLHEHEQGRQRRREGREREREREMTHV